MNKKLKFIVAGVAIVAGLASAVSCQDLSKDVEDLGKRVSTLENTVKDLQTKIDAGALITSVTSTATGVKVTLNNGNSFDIANGKDGANGTNGKDGKDGKDGVDGTPGSVVTIGENGNWYLDGVDTGLKAAGKDGKDGVDGKDGKDGIDGKDGKDGIDGKDGKDGVDGKDGDSIYWTIEDGKFVEYKNGEKTGNEVSFAEAGQLYAVWADDMITFYNVWDPETEAYVSKTVYTTSYTPDAEIASISLVESYTALTDQILTTGNPWDLSVNFVDVIELEQDFYGLPFGGQTNRGDAFLVRVSPTNYQLTAEDITIVSSDGTELNDLLEIEVEPFEGLLTKSENGLWIVNVALKEYDEDVFEDYTQYVPAPGAAPLDILFAVKAGDAISSYDLTFHHNDYIPEFMLDYFVGGIGASNWIGAINNRFDNTSISLDNPGAGTLYTEKAWSRIDPVSGNPIPYTAMGKVGGVNNYNTADGILAPENDNRSALPTYKAIKQQAFPIYVMGDIKAIYVTLDFKANAIDSAPSEWNAWTSYDITGLNELSLNYITFPWGQPGVATTLCINSGSADGDIIGFRVYAVNWDGTLVDPDGKAFYVQVGQQGASWSSVATTMSTPTDFLNTRSNDVAFTASKVDAVTVDFTMDDPTAPAFDLQILRSNNTTLTTLPANTAGWTYDGSWGITGGGAIAAAKVRTVPAVALWNYTDGKTYTGTLTIRKAAAPGATTGVPVATMKVSFTKTLPTAAPSGYSVKTGQLDANGVYNCYMVPDNWAANAATVGTMDMPSVFNFPSFGGASLAGNYIISFAESNKVGSNLVPVNTVGSGTITIDKSYIDNAKQHATTVLYNYGDISSVKHAAWVLDPTVDRNVYVGVDSFPTVYNCIYNNTYTWAWKWSVTKTGGVVTGSNYPGWTGALTAGFFPTAAPTTTMTPEIIYEDFNTGVMPVANIQGTSAWDSAYDAPLGTPYNGSLAIQSAKLTSNANGVEEYYDVSDTLPLTFTKVSGATNPTVDVPSTLTITYKDMYGHNVNVKMPVIVKRR